MFSGECAFCEKPDGRIVACVGCGSHACENCITRTDEVETECPGCPNQSPKARKERRRKRFEEILVHEAHRRKVTVLLLDYIDMLVAELEETSGIAFVHGWRSSRVEEGKRLRAELGVPELSDTEITKG